jgi:hypothetical protein
VRHRHLLNKFNFEEDFLSRKSLKQFYIHTIFSCLFSINTQNFLSLFQISFTSNSFNSKKILRDKQQLMILSSFSNQNIGARPRLDLPKSKLKRSVLSHFQSQKRQFKISNAEVSVLTFDQIILILDFTKMTTHIKHKTSNMTASYDYINLTSILNFPYQFTKF